MSTQLDQVHVTLRAADRTVFTNHSRAVAAAWRG